MNSSLARILAVLACVAIPVVPSSPLRPFLAPAAHAAAVPSGLPTHFGIGLSAAPDSTGLDGWMPNSQIPWDYAYQYLSGGVNTGSGWETWNSNGQFALWYAQSAASNHYIPFFSYYDLLQSKGSCSGCGEAQTDIANLNNPGLMASYYQNFTLLMKRLGSGTYDGIAGFGKTAIVQIEPDFTGGYALQAVLNNGGACFGYCTGQGDNPAYLKASVASSSVTDVAAFPNTFQGFNWALLHLRDLYAPNVQLAFHISNWGAMFDVGSDTSSSLDAASLGQTAGSFAAQSGITGVPAGSSTYDLLTNDVLDRDAGYYKYVYGNSSVWWDRLNVTFPNFHRWEAFIGAAHQAAGRFFLIWQIPEGNQYFDTENNTNGHYQDNRAEYFFGHIGELVQSGIIGLLFGAGNGGSTVHWDGSNDGITNPASFCTTDGLSSGQICNNHTSTVADDDGGYIRTMAQQYYASGGYPLSGTAPTSTPTAVPSATPTKAPTSIPTTMPPATPTRYVTPTPLPTQSALKVTVRSASASPATVAVNGTERLAATVTSNTALSGAIVDFEIYNASGAKVYQSYQSTKLSANVPRALTANWGVPSSEPAGTYTLKIGVFAAGWSQLYVWNNGAATFTVT